MKLFRSHEKNVSPDPGNNELILAASLESDITAEIK